MRYLRMRREVSSAYEWPSHPNSLEAVDETSVGSQLEVLHDFLQADEVLDVDGWGELELVGGGVEVEQVNRATE